jgi:hypothetical protein
MFNKFNIGSVVLMREFFPGISREIYVFPNPESLEKSVDKSGKQSKDDFFALANKNDIAGLVESLMESLFKGNVL